MIHPSANVHRTVEIFGDGPLEIGENVRIDAFTVITVGEHGVKIGAH